MGVNTSRYRHNKKRNTAFLFEALIKEMAKCVLTKDTPRQAKVAQIIKTHYAKNTALYQELQLYKAINETKEASQDIARRIIIEARLQSSRLSSKHVFTEQSDLIKQINHNLGTDVYANFVPNYKSLASIAQLFSDATTVKKTVLLEDSLIEMMVEKPHPDAKSKTMEPIDNLVYKTFATKFNEQYSGRLQEEQRAVLTRFVYSISDNGVSLKSYLNEEVDRLRAAVKQSYKADEIRNDEKMLSNAKRVVEYLDSLHKTPLTETEVKKILKIQELVREVGQNG
jgi:hypothetical protein